MTPKLYQPIAKAKLENLYTEVKIEWPSITKDKNIYCPRPDIVVGPFAINTRYETEYDRLLKEPLSKKFINRLLQKHNENIITLDVHARQTNIEDLTYFNRNARCFLCIEVENKVSRKHLIGGLVNASALGRVAVLVAWNSEKLRAFLKLRNYLLFLSSVGKNTFKTDNVLILSKDQFNACFSK